MNGTVTIRTDSGKLVAGTPATEKHGFRVSLHPGGYVLSVVVIAKLAAGGFDEADSCPAQTKVSIHAGKNKPVRIYAECEVVPAA